MEVEAGDPLALQELKLCTYEVCVETVDSSKPDGRGARIQGLYPKGFPCDVLPYRFQSQYYPPLYPYLHKIFGIVLCEVFNFNDRALSANLCATRIIQIWIRIQLSHNSEGTILSVRLNG